MAGDRNTRIGLLLAKVETTDGVDASPTAAANAVLINEPFDASGEHVFKHERPRLVVGSAIQQAPPLTPKGLVGSGWSNTVHLRGTKDGAAYSASNLPPLDPFLQSAGFSGTVTTTAGSEKVVYKPAATGLKSHTEYYYVDGKLTKLLGAKSDIDIAFDAGGPVIATVKRTGLYTAPTDTAVPTTQNFGTSVPPVVDSVALSINSYSAGIIRKFSCSFGNQIVQRPNANAAGGLATHRIRHRAIKFSVVLEDELAATLDVEALKANRTTCPITWFVNASQYNRIRWTASNAIIEDVKYGDDNGTRIVTISGGCFDSDFAANDAVALAFE